MGGLVLPQCSPCAPQFAGWGVGYSGCPSALVGLQGGRSRWPFYFIYFYFMSWKGPTGIESNSWQHTNLGSNPEF